MLLQTSSFILCCWLLTSTLNTAPKTVDEIPYPEGYRSWTHVKSAIIGAASPAFKRFGGIHHIYANAKAREGFRSGTFEDGAIFVFDVIELKEEKDGTTEEGDRRFIDVMVKDSRRYDSTGGWGFEEFNQNSNTERIVKEFSKKKCFHCHATREKEGFVFSSFRN